MDLVKKIYTHRNRANMKKNQQQQRTNNEKRDIGFFNPPFLRMYGNKQNVMIVHRPVQMKCDLPLTVRFC